MKTLSLTNDEYRQKEGVSNSELMLIERSPSDYMWAKNAPRDEMKTAAFDFGTALHTAILEPEKFNDQVIVYSQTKTRETKAFQEFMLSQSKNSIILLESEHDKIRFAADGAKYHPAVNRLLTIKSDKEGSIFVKDKERGITRKIRPDLDYVLHGNPALADLKSTANLADWRQDARWKNPLFTHGYAHTAAYYMDTASLEYGVQIDEYIFIVVQKAIEMGRYPVAAITITRQELEMLGAFDQVNYNLDTYATCLHSNNWDSVERFPMFANDGEILIEDA